MGDPQDRDYMTSRQEQEEDCTDRKLERIVASQGRVESSLAELQKKAEKIIMGQATLADLDAEIQGDLTTAATSIISLLTIVEGKIENGQDFSVEIANIKTIANNLKTAVTGAGALTFAPATLSLSLANGPTATVVATGNGNVQASFPDGTVATVSPASGVSPATFTVTAVAVGTATLTGTDALGNTATLVVTVTA